MKGSAAGAAVGNESGLFSAGCATFSTGFAKLVGRVNGEATVAGGLVAPCAGSGGLLKKLGILFSDGLSSAGVVIVIMGTDGAGFSFSAFSRSARSFSERSFSWRSFSSASFFRVASRIFIMAFASKSCFSHLEYILWPALGLLLVVSTSPGGPAEDARVGAEAILFLGCTGYCWKGLTLIATSTANDCLRESKETLPFVLGTPVLGNSDVGEAPSGVSEGGGAVDFHKRLLPTGEGGGCALWQTGVNDCITEY